VMIARCHASDCQQATTGDVCPVHQSLLMLRKALCGERGAGSLQQRKDSSLPLLCCHISARSLQLVAWCYLFVLTGTYCRDGLTSFVLDSSWKPQQSRRITQCPQSISCGFEKNNSHIWNLPGIIAYIDFLWFAKSLDPATPSSQW
jgi:hypothetical protein